MLVVSRKEGECLLIGDNIRVTVVRVGKGQVRIGIDAPDDAVIARSEVAFTNTNNGPAVVAPDGTHAAAKAIAPAPDSPAESVSKALRRRAR